MADRMALRREVEADVEDLAMMLHESGRAAVAAGAVVNRVPGRPFHEWHQLSAAAREGRRIQARYLLGRCSVVPFTPRVGGAG